MILPVLALLLAQQSPASLSLDDALRQALRARGRPGFAAAAVAEARAERRLAGQLPNPNLSYEHTGDPPRQHLLVDQSFSWLLTRGSDRAAARAGIRRAQADSVAALADLFQEVRLAFFAAIGAGETLRLVQAQADLSDSLARIAQVRLDAGDISRLEYEQNAQEARRGRQLLSESRENARAAAASLGRAIGWSEALPPAPLGALDAGLETELTESLPADSIPLVRAAVADSLAASLSLLSARRARLPLPSLTAGADWEDPGDPGRTLSVIGFSLPLPLWNTGGGEVALAGARATQAAAEAREVRLEAALAVADARIRLEESARRARFARDSLIPGARQLRERAVAAYRAGETGVLPVLDALRGEREALLGGVQDLVAFQAAVARWHALFGRTP